jgi:prolipoprotein diacylglyceryltransferase
MHLALAVALWLEKRRLKPGVLAAILLIVYSLFRFGIDFVRYYENSANLWGNQIVALGMTALGVVLLILFLRWPFKPAQANAGARK